MGAGTTLMIFGLGDVGGWVLEYLARATGVGTIIGCDKRDDWGRKKIECTAVGAGHMGHSKKILFEQVDVHNIERTAELIEKYNPDLIYSCMTLLSWTKPLFLPKEVKVKLQRIVGPMLPMHLTLPYMLMQAVKKSDSKAVILNNSWADFINPVLCNAGYPILVGGGGNLDNVAGEVRRKLSLLENVPIADVKLYLIFEHSVNTFGTRTGIPYFFKAVVGDRDITCKYDVDSLISDRLLITRPEWIMWHHASIVASSSVKHILAILNNTNELSHAPGPNGLIGGYPIRIGSAGVKVELPEDVTLEQAIQINIEGGKYEGVEEIKNDGTIVFTDAAHETAKEVLNLDYKELRLKDTAQRAEEIITAYVDLTRKHKVPFTPY
jgi:hypothetical protein